jgi:hypothetical protein
MLCVVLRDCACEKETNVSFDYVTEKRIKRGETDRLVMEQFKRRAQGRQEREQCIQRRCEVRGVSDGVMMQMKSCCLGSMAADAMMKRQPVMLA